MQEALGERNAVLMERDEALRYVEILKRRIAAVEFLAPTGQGGCPWCEALPPWCREDTEHEPTCEAFERRGVVR
jgi:hypothetical protein